MANKFFGIYNTHPSYVLGGYECKCGYTANNIKYFNEHVYSNHDKEFAKEVLSARDYWLKYEPEKYQKMLDERKEKKEFKKLAKNRGYRWSNVFKVWERDGIWLTNDELKIILRK